MSEQDGLDPAAISAPYDPTVLNLFGSRADVAWLRASGITNIPERLTALLDDYDRLAALALDLQGKVARVEALPAVWRTASAHYTGLAYRNAADDLDAVLADQPEQEQQP